MNYTLFGIPNCDTVKKARTWLDDKGVSFNFHNYKKDGISAEQIQHWLEQVPLKTVLNKASATYRKLSDIEKQQTDVEASAVALLVENPSMIKRPVLMKNDDVIAVGFKPDLYESLFQ